MAKKTKPRAVRKSKKSSVKAAPSARVEVTHSLFTPHFWKGNLLPASLIFIIGLGLYLRAIPYEYVLDDQIVITKNIYTQQGFKGIWNILSTESFQGYFQEQKDLVVGARYRPLSIVTFAMEYGLIGSFNRQVSHFINALFYALCGLLLFRVLSLIFRESDTEKWFLNLGFWAAMIWVVHPLHTEAVANIKGRDEIMSLIGALASLYFSMRYVDRKRILDLIYAAVAFFLGMLSKETPVTFLGVIPLTIYFFQTTSLKRIILTTLPLLGVFLIYLIIRVQVIGYLLDSGQEITDIMNNPFANMTFGQQYATIFYTLLLYLKLLFVPYPLTHDYYPFHIPTMEWTDILPLLSLFIHLALGIIGLLSLKKRTIPGYAILFYLMTLSVVSNLFFPVGSFMNERFLFMPSVAVGIVIAYYVLKGLPVVSKRITPTIAVAGLTLLSLAFAYRTFTRIPAWKSPLSLNASAVKVSKNSARANCFMGTALFNAYKEMPDGGDKREVLEKAASYLWRSKELFPEYYNANLMLAGVVAEQYKYHNDFDFLLENLKSIATVRPGISYLYEYYDYIIERAPDSGKLLDYFYDVGKNVLIDQKFDFNYGLRHLYYAERIDPNNREVIAAMADIFQKLGNPERAQSYLNRLQ